MNASKKGLTRMIESWKGQQIDQTFHLGLVEFVLFAVASSAAEPSCN